MTITCRSCKQTVEVNMYFYNVEIKVSDNINHFGKKLYSAYADGKSICPNCGKEIREIFYRFIPDKDIIRFCTSEE